MQHEQQFPEHFLSILERSHEAVLCWEIEPALPLASLDREELEQASRLVFCNDRAVELLGYPDAAALAAAKPADLDDFLAISSLIGEFFEDPSLHRESCFGFTDLLGCGKSVCLGFQGVVHDDRLVGSWCTLREITSSEEVERHLATSKRLLSDTESLAKMGSWSRDLTSGEMSISEQLPRLFGLKPKGRPYDMTDFLAVIHPADRPSLQAAREQLSSNQGIFRADYRVLMPDGGTLHMHSLSFASMDEEGQPARMLGTVQDVSGIRLEAERRQAHYDNHPDPMFLIELDEGMPVSMPVEQQRIFLQQQSRIGDCNEALLKLLDSPREEVLGRKLEFLEQLWELNATRFSENGFQLKNRVVKLRQPRHPGEVSWIQFDATGTVEGVVLTRIWGCLRDVTELVQARNQLQTTVNERTRKLYMEIERRKQNEQLLKQQAVISAHMSEAVIIWDLQGVIIDWNEGASRVFGFSREQALGKTSTLMNRGGRADQRPANMPLWFAEHESWHGEQEFVHHDGREVICESSITALRDDRDRIISIIEVNRDITERKAYDLQLSQAKREAEQANQAKSQFLWAMSHELRTPLNAILGFTQMLERLDAGPMSDQQRSYMSHIKSGGEHLLRLVNDVLDLAKIEAGEFGLVIAPVDPEEVCREALEMVQPQAAERQVTVETDFGAAVQILADYTRLKQVLVNLMINGVKYNSQGGLLKVRVRPGVRKVRIEISDTGEGIAEDKIPDLFEPFNRLGVTDVQVVGAGLGLPISSRLVAAMDAHMGVDSEVGKGSTFWLEFAMVGPEYQLALDW